MSTNTPSRSQTAARTGSALASNYRDRPIVKELSTKLAWAVGSTLHITYGERSKTKEWAEDLACRLYSSHPAHGPGPSPSRT